MLPWNVLQKHSIPLNSEFESYDCFLLTNKESIAHFINSKVTHACLLVNNDNTMDLFISSFEAPFITLEKNNKMHVINSNRHGFFEEIKEILNDRKIKTVAVEAQDISFFDYTKFFQYFHQKLVWFDTSGIRRIKSSKQLMKIQNAAKAIDNVYKKTVAYIKKERTNLSELDIAKFIKLEASKLNAELSFDVIVASGVNGQYPHALPTNKKLQNGELITIDCGIKLDHYCSDMTRMLSLGKPTDSILKIYHYILEAQKASIAKLKAGVSFFKLHVEAISIFQKYGVAKYYIHGIGHGIGQVVHEKPFPIKQKGQEVLFENDVITIEPGLYKINNTGGRIEDMFIVKKDGFVQLTNSSKELII